MAAELRGGTAWIAPRTTSAHVTTVAIPRARVPSHARRAASRAGRAKEQPRTSAPVRSPREEFEVDAARKTGGTIQSREAGPDRRQSDGRGQRALQQGQLNGGPKGLEKEFIEYGRYAPHNSFAVSVVDSVSVNTNGLMRRRVHHFPPATVEFGIERRETGLDRPGNP